MLSPLLWTTPNLGCTPADGVYPGYLTRFSPYLVSYAGCGRDARDPRGGYAIISNAPSQTPQLLSPSEYAHARDFLEISQIHDRFVACGKAGLVQLTSIALFRDFHFKTQKD